MKKIEILVPIVLIIAGLSCLTMSGSFMFGQGFGVYFKTFTGLCLWMAIPLVVVALVYLIFLRKRR